MFSYYKHLLSEPKWLIYEKGWKPERQQVMESLLAIGNGYVGSRSVLEGIPLNASAGTYFAGIYDITGAQVTEIINAPNPFSFKVIIDGEKLELGSMDYIDHIRVLDMKKGMLIRNTLFLNRNKKRFDFQSLRFISRNNMHIACMQIYLTPLDKKCKITVESVVDTAVTNKGLITEGRKKHFHIIDVEKIGRINYLCVKTLEKEILLSYASQLNIKKENRIFSAPHRTFKLWLKKGETVCFTKYFSFFTSKDTNPKRIKNKTVKTLQTAVKKEINRLITEHSKAWLKKWENSNIEIEGAPEIEKKVRFNIYHLLISADESIKDVSICARTLTGEGYRGHIFWDTEIFILPFFTYTNPQIAKNLLLYRYNRLDAARYNARLRGYKGAMFPWESADTGQEETPSWYKDTQGNIKNVTTGEFEQHISADIAYAVYHYFVVTKDLEFMIKYGLEIIIETARFWVSRVKFNKKKKKFEIKHVTGPDEYHEDVNNNAYTNLMAKWNLETANKLYKMLKQNHRATVFRLMNKIDLTVKEVGNFRNIANRIYIPFSKKKNIIEAFDGYFKKRKLPILRFDKNHLPIAPKGISNFEKTQFQKQPDTIMAFYLLSDSFNKRLKKENYVYYIKRTLHRSSLSPSLSSTIGVEVGDKTNAYKYFLTSVNIDLKNIYNNTSEGIHGASLGGTWQAVINGFAGMRIENRVLSFNPRLPASWKKIKFSVKWEGFNIFIDVDKEKIMFSFYSNRVDDYIPIKVYGKLRNIRANKTSIFYKNMS